MARANSMPIKYISDTGAGVVVNSADPSALVGGLRALLADPDLGAGSGLGAVKLP